MAGRREKSGSPSALLPLLGFFLFSLLRRGRASASLRFVLRLIQGRQRNP